MDWNHADQTCGQLQLQVCQLQLPRDLPTSTSSQLPERSIATQFPLQPKAIAFVFSQLATIEIANSQLQLKKIHFYKSPVAIRHNVF
jgi:hypothetical protein